MIGCLPREMKRLQQLFCLVPPSVAFFQLGFHHQNALPISSRVHKYFSKECQATLTILQDLCTR
ncbi:hypothetical protein T4D_4575 [Trichinella pseudospiralis]|uniref:Uncharacterized protein n=1 Tax=Trichinella pseudospiralis TaxID=6337 RepID=A0A0V1FBI3_TRIPS|nr:hypothetical protein T4D_4575 [Trichinella pseudospiralis]